VIESAGMPMRVVQPLPQFPAIDRDLSIVVDEGVRWAQVEAIVRGGESGRSPEQATPTIESLRYVTTFRDEAKVGKGKKVVTLRLRFRAPDRTLRSEETEPPVAGLVSRLGSELGAVLRA
jgi:phenylalanyl-tRNA synthetase beta chain